MVVVRGWGNGEFLFKRLRVSVLQDEVFCGVDGGDGCAIVRVFLMLLSCTLKMVKW